jgi:hypothetical protein
MNWLGTVPDESTLGYPTVAVGDRQSVPHPGETTRLGLVGVSPATGRVQLCIESVRASQMRLTVYDVAGRHVCTLVDGGVPIGKTLVSWDGQWRGGSRVGSGVYFARLVVDAGSVVVRVPLVW